MSRILRARNVNDAFQNAIWHMKTEGLIESSRNGRVLVNPGLFVTEYSHPWEHILWHKPRRANHVFHLMEAIWMLAGRNDVDFLLPFNSGYAKYADEGKIHGAYGHRWRKLFDGNYAVGPDQLGGIVYLLKKDPTSRQAVLQMWNFEDQDLTGSWRDRPCNTHAYFDLRGGKLNMTVCCRSNDMLWGAYGANVVHFSILQEVLASELKVQIGSYRQMSNNFHLYLDNPMVQLLLDVPPHGYDDKYVYGKPTPPRIPFVAEDETLEDILQDAEDFCNYLPTWTNFITRVATPLREAYLARKDPDAATVALPACDWTAAYLQWLNFKDGQNVSE